MSSRSTRACNGSSTRSSRCSRSAWSEPRSPGAHPGRCLCTRAALPAGAAEGALFYLTLPVRLARELRSFRPHAILTQSPYEAAAVLVGRRLAGSDARLVVDVHGDWRTLSRLYGSRLRALLRPLTDRIAVAAL